MLRHLNGSNGRSRRRLPARLAEALDEAQTTILLVFGTGPGPDAAERRCRSLAGAPGFEALRVVRLEDGEALEGAIPASWLAPGRLVTLLGPDRRTALPIEVADAVELFVAVSAFS
jgi:hypothetical protein